MGTPEFPDLGKHCSVEECKQIDFLPFTCDRCNQFMGNAQFFPTSNGSIDGLVGIYEEILGGADCRLATLTIQENGPPEVRLSHPIALLIRKSQNCSFSWTDAMLGNKSTSRRSFVKHHCPNANKQDVTVVICPLCAIGVRLVPEEDPNITWESHVNTDCDPSNYEKATKKKKCPVPRCREILTFSNTIRCRDCTIDHCLKHRFGPDHNCAGPKKPDSGFPFIELFKRSQKENTRINRTPTASSSSSSSPAWATSFLSAASTVRASAEAGMAKLSIATNQALQTARDGMGQSSDGSNGQMEECPQCRAKFSSVTALVDHVEKVHERGNRGGVKKVTIDVCPKCSRGFRDPVALVNHVEKDHGGTSRA